MKLIVTRWKEKPDTEYAGDGLIRKSSVKPEYGSMMVASREMGVVNGFVNSRKKVGFIGGTVEELEAMIKEHNLEDGSDFSEQVSPHRIIVLEMVESDLNGELGFTEKKNPSTGQILSKYGEVIYRKTEVVAEGSDLKDVYITHDKEDAPTDEAKTEFTKEKTLIKEL